MIKYSIFLIFAIISCMAPLYEKSSIPKTWNFRIGMGFNYCQMMMYEGGDLCFWSIYK